MKSVLLFISNTYIMEEHNLKDSKCYCGSLYSLSAVWMFESNVLCWSADVTVVTVDKQNELFDGDDEGCSSSSSSI